MKNNPLLRLSLTLFLITAIVAAALAGVNAITKDRIAANQAEKVRLAISEVLPGADAPAPLDLPAGSDPAVAAVFTDSALPGACCIEVHPLGFGGPLVLMVGVDEAGAVTGISVVSHSETPNLGAVAAAPTSRGQAFRQQFTGADAPLAVTKDGGTVEAISSATITSRGVVEGVNIALNWVKTFG